MFKLTVVLCEGFCSAIFNWFQLCSIQNFVFYVLLAAFSRRGVLSTLFRERKAGVQRFNLFGGYAEHTYGSWKTLIINR